MKKHFYKLTVLIIVTVSFLLAGCSKKQEKVFFEAEKINQIELYRFVVPNQAEKKVVTEKEEIWKICESLQFEVSDKKRSALAGSETTSFRLSFTDGRTAEIIYMDGEKENSIRILEEELLEGSTAADLGQIWDRCTVTAVTANEQELPFKSSLTLDRVVELAKKGMELSWEDFREYYGSEVGSGLLILYYPVDEDYYLLVGGGNQEEKPMYIRLVRAENQEEFIDIRTDDMEDFISGNPDGTGAFKEEQNALEFPEADKNKKIGRESMVGRILVSAEKEYLIIDENGMPVVLSSMQKDNQMFDGLQSGDKIKITFDGIQESYPAQTGVYTCELLEQGNMEDIPEETIRSLKELGWSF